MGLSKTRVSPIAIDFGSDSIKLLQVVATDPPQMVAIACAPLPPEARTEMAARWALIPQIIRKLLSEHPFKGKRAICSIPAYQTLVQNLQLPKNDALDYEQRVAMQLRERLNIEPEKMVIRSCPVNVVQDANHEEVVCMAASRDTVMRYLKIAKQAKLDVVGMHCEPMALIQAFSHLYRRQSDTQRTTAFIDIGCSSTKLVIAHSGSMVFIKSIYVGGDQLNKQYAQQMDISYDQARSDRYLNAMNHQDQNEPAGPDVNTAFKETSDTNQTARPTTPSGIALLDPQSSQSQQTDPTQTQTLTTTHRQLFAGPSDDSDPLDCMIDELLMCKRYHQKMFPDRPLENLVFLGGEARHVAICQKIAKAMNIGAQLGDPLARLIRHVKEAGAHQDQNQPTDRGPMTLDLRQPQPGWAVPMGLSISETNL